MSVTSWASRWSRASSRLEPPTADESDVIDVDAAADLDEVIGRVTLVLGTSRPANARRRRRNPDDSRNWRERPRNFAPTSRRGGSQSLPSGPCPSTCFRPHRPSRWLASKHPRAIRWLHWINFPLLIVMIWSGLRIYWAEDVYAFGIGGWQWFAFFPDVVYETLDLDRRLARGMAFHFAFGWLFVINGLIYAIYLAVERRVAAHPPRPPVAARGQGRRLARPPPHVARSRRRAATTPPSGSPTRSCW